ncbi:MAG: hypothetical protein JW839_18790 [Candidatus Lokiarchaeota archaeon]|nr:hypothetical protein [Candidatus Lokiarchaeota archaeon]
MTAPDLDSPFVDLRKLDVHAVYGAQPVAFFIAGQLVHHVIVGMARRVQDRAELERVARVAGGDATTWSPHEREAIECLVAKQRVGRAEEWILSRYIKKRGTEVFRDVTGSSGTPFTSISHSAAAVVVSLSDVPAGIDHEVIEPRGKSWSRRMDPGGDTRRLAGFLSAWLRPSLPETETMVWAAKEASLKAWGIAQVASVPSVRIDGREGRICASIMDGTADERRCKVLLRVEEGCVLALALNDQE